MEKENILKALKKLRKEAKKRNFNQSVDFSILLKEIDLNNPDEKIDEFVVLPNRVEKETKVCALVDKALTTKAREVCDKVIIKDEFSDWKESPRKIKKLADEFDYFIAQATIMSDIAATFGKYFGPKQKMPNPKSGSIISPKADLEKTVKRLQKTVHLKAKKQPVISSRVGTEEMKDEEIIDNITYIYDIIQRKLPRGKQQIKQKIIKFTMSKPVVLE